MTTSNPTPSQLHAQVTTHLQTRYSLPVNATWLSSFLNSTRQPYPPLPALASTAHFRILASDIRQSLASSSGSGSGLGSGILPSDISNTSTKQRVLESDVIVQLLDISDAGRSKSSQIEVLERIERGEEVKGREVVRVVPGITEGNSDDEGDRGARAGQGGGDGGGRGTAGTGGGGIATSKRSTGPHTLILQDCKGTKVTAFEMADLSAVSFILGPVEAASGGQSGGMGVSIGCKLLLKKGTVVRRGMVMLVPENVVVLGGKIDEWDRRWREGRKEVWKGIVEGQQEERNGDGDRERRG